MKSDKSLARTEEKVPAYNLDINDKNKNRVLQRRAQRAEFRIALIGVAREPRPTQGY